MGVQIAVGVRSWRGRADNCGKGKREETGTLEKGGDGESSGSLMNKAKPSTWEH